MSMSGNESKIKYKIILIGDSNVGKTCIFKKLATGQFSEKIISTIGVDRRTLSLEINTNKEGEPEKKQNCVIQLWEKYVSVLLQKIITSHPKVYYLYMI